MPIFFYNIVESDVQRQYEIIKYSELGKTQGRHLLWGFCLWITFFSDMKGGSQVLTTSFHVPLLPSSGWSFKNHSATELPPMILSYGGRWRLQTIVGSRLGP